AQLPPFSLGNDSPGRPAPPPPPFWPGAPFSSFLGGFSFFGFFPDSPVAPVGPDAPLAPSSGVVGVVSVGGVVVVVAGSHLALPSVSRRRVLERSALRRLRSRRLIPSICSWSAATCCFAPVQ